jgi:isocitrate dehydrogenase (NAD+)
MENFESSTAQMYNIMLVFQAAGVPVDFETFFFSEVHHTMSAPLEDVAKSIATNGICLKV